VNGPQVFDEIFYYVPSA